MVEVTAGKIRKKHRIAVVVTKLDSGEDGTRGRGGYKATRGVCRYGVISEEGADSSNTYEEDSPVKIGGTVVKMYEKVLD